MTEISLKDYIVKQSPGRMGRIMQTLAGAVLGSCLTMMAACTSMGIGAGYIAWDYYSTPPQHKEVVSGVVNTAVGRHKVIKISKYESWDQTDKLPKSYSITIFPKGRSPYRTIVAKDLSPDKPGLSWVHAKYIWGESCDTRLLTRIPPCPPDVEEELERLVEEAHTGLYEAGKPRMDV